MRTAAFSSSRVSDSLVQSIAFLGGEQLPSGEIPNYRNLPNGSWEYCFSPLVSAYVHDALACFDALSPRLDAEALEQVAPTARPGFSRAATLIRRRIRRFLAWQESPDGTWRFFGTGSSLAPDLDTTACAAAALIEARGGMSARDIKRTGEALQRLCKEAGRSREVEIESELQAAGIANALRYFAMTGFETDECGAVLREMIQGSPCASNRVLFLYTMSRAHLHGRLAGLESIRSGVLTEVLECHDPAHVSSEPLTAALATLLLLYLGHEDELYARRIEVLLDWLTPIHGRRFERLGDANCGSAALTTAWIMAALAKAEGGCA